jgi:probable rRNA maturation factor
MLTIENNTTLMINFKQLESITLALTSREIDLSICYNPIIQKINAEYRGKDSATDVLSFPIESDFLGDVSHMPLGSIVISADFVTDKATELAHSNDDELALLFIHGLLHLLGYDHEVDSGEMRVKEEALIRKFNLPKSLIIRGEAN